MERQLGDWITSYLEYTSNTEPCELYREWVAVSTVAAALKRKVKIEWGTETWYPNMYIVLVGPPAARKGTAMRVGREFLDKVDIRLASDNSSREALIKELMESTEMEISDGFAQAPHSSLTVHSEELSNFLGHNRIDFLQTLARWFDCPANWEYNTLSRGSEVTKNVWVNILGATTPSLIQQNLPQDTIGGGLSSRMIFVYARDKGKIIPLPFLSDEQKRLKPKLIHDLELIKQIKGVYHLTEEASKAYMEWYVETNKNPPFPHNPYLLGYNERRATHLMSLAIILAASADAHITVEGKKIPAVTKAIFDRASKLLVMTEVLMPKTFEGYGASKMAALTQRITSYMKQVGTATEAELVKVFMWDIESREQLTSVMDILRVSGVVSHPSKVSLGATSLTYIYNGN